MFFFSLCLSLKRTGGIPPERLPLHSTTTKNNMLSRLKKKRKRKTGEAVGLTHKSDKTQLECIQLFF